MLLMITYFKPTLKKVKSMYIMLHPTRSQKVKAKNKMDEGPMIPQDVRSCLYNNTV